MPDVTGQPFPPKGPNLFSRRQFIATTMKLAVAGAVVPGALSQLLPGMAPIDKASSGAQPVITRDAATNAPRAVTIADLKPQPENQPFVGEWNFLPAIVYMVKQTVLKGSSTYHKYNTAQFAVQHPTNPDYAIMVYEGKCKHLGCTVGWNGALGAAKPEVGKEDYDGDGLNDGRILCPCHQGQYDIHNLARNQPATPPPQPLNVIIFNVAANYADPANKIAGGANAIVATGKKEQTKYLDADLDSKVGNTAFALGSQAAKLG